MSDTLGKLFGSAARVKLLRLFLLNPSDTFTLDEVAARARISSAEARRELTAFTRIKLTTRAARGRGKHYTLNGGFPYLTALQNLFLNAPAQSEEVYSRVRQAGAIKLIVIAGIFLGEWNSILDLFVVGERIQDRKLKNNVRVLESQMGKELRYAYLSTEEFLYRLNMNDHLVRDVFDYSHRIIFDKLDIGLK
ncbi:hypothetical protein HYS79_00135 [Patescibacteria group bacterium]|nr:hypothetical protein [Patescibacteria group bacterium]